MSEVRNASGWKREFEGHDLGGHHNINAVPFGLGTYVGTDSD